MAPSRLLLLCWFSGSSMLPDIGFLRDARGPRSGDARHKLGKLSSLERTGTTKTRCVVAKQTRDSYARLTKLR
ncbi:hypothetical protein HBI24_017350 [Parastagonospora nodorum]|nr:hypothetical protein HBH51_037010 [Parastagonospora nodorum]KAH4005373.1 hypothetical protein HBI10_033590 [Parastagonospora nodorum]KAH4033050.1 hypothetical protein HBI13_005510 [Parastagonospora nodorum]KAH5086045.1 hypothetical protein HBH95_016560 [Parastagonospora nodorum]KAH5100432.1 hypothetical protein HBH72_100220 [Parastagonospora nodorum]